MQRLGPQVPDRYAALFGFVHARTAETRCTMELLRATAADETAAGPAARLLADDYELCLGAIAAVTCRGFRPTDVELLAVAALGHAQHPDFRPEWQTVLAGAAA